MGNIKIYGYLLEVSIHNARVIYERATSQKTCPIKFREKLALALIGKHEATRPQLFVPARDEPLEKTLRRDLRHLPAPTPDDLARLCHCCREKSLIAVCNVSFLSIENKTASNADRQLGDKERGEQRLCRFVPINLIRAK